MAAEGRTRRQQEIIDAARDLLVRDGVEALSVGRIAQALGIRPPSLYKHFDGKRAIEAAPIADGLADFAAVERFGDPGGPTRNWDLRPPSG